MAKLRQFKDDAKPESKRRREKNRREAKDRAMRNAARRDAIKRGAAKKGDGKDIDHKDGNPQNNSPSNLRSVSPSKNRSLKGSKNGMSKKNKYAGGGEVGGVADYKSLVQQLYGTVGGEQAAKDIARRGMSINPMPGKFHTPSVKKPSGVKAARTLKGGGLCRKRR